MGVRDVPNDPERPKRILRAALEVIAERGVGRASHGRIAQVAGVSQGSLTYYFDGIGDIYQRAFALLAAEMAEDYDRALRQARSQDEAIEAVTGLICGDFISETTAVLLAEMYAYATRDPMVRSTLHEWSNRSRASLSRHFSSACVPAIDALIEGWPLHRRLHGQGLDRSGVLAAVEAIARSARPALG